MSDEELRKTLAKLFDKGTLLKSRAGGTVEAEFFYKNYSVDEAMQFIKNRETKILDRLTAQQSICHDCIHDDEEMGTVPYVSLNAVLAELAALKEVKK